MEYYGDLGVIVDGWIKKLYDACGTENCADELKPHIGKTGEFCTGNVL